MLMGLTSMSKLCLLQIDIMLVGVRHSVEIILA